MKDWLKNIVLKILVIPILLILLFVPIITHNMPQEANFDATVYDDANILSPNTEVYIAQLNNKYANYKRQPPLNSRQGPTFRDVGKNIFVCLHKLLPLLSLPFGASIPH